MTRGFRNDNDIVSEQRIRERLKLGLMILGQTILIVAAFVKMMVDMEYSKQDRVGIRAEMKEAKQENTAQHKEIMEKLQHHMDREDKTK
jgi:hypothetical protein